MLTLKGDKDGIAGRYEGHGKVWNVRKVYVGRGVGARWYVEGPFFAGGACAFQHSQILDIVANWAEQGVRKVA